MSLLCYHPATCRDPESAAGCSCGCDHHSDSAATWQSQTGLPVEDEAKVAQSRGAFLSSGLCLQWWRQVLKLNITAGGVFD